MATARLRFVQADEAGAEELNTAPLVSVIVPMRNAEAYVTDALSSILQQTGAVLEVVVVDDGSSDRSRERVVRIGDSRVRIVEGPCKGIAASMNTGLAAARGSILMRCDADDLYPAERIGDQLAWLDAHPEHGAVCGAFRTIDVRGKAVAQLLSDQNCEQLDIEEELRHGILRTHLCTYAIRRTAFDRAGPFREYFETGEDIDFALRLGEVCRIGYLPSNAYVYRLHEESVTHSQQSVRRLFFKEAALEFQVQRREHGSDALMQGKPPAPPNGGTRGASSARTQIRGMLIGQSWADLKNRRTLAALSHAWRASLTTPLRTAGWWNLLKILLTVALRRGL